MSTQVLTTKWKRLAITGRQFWLLPIKDVTIAWNRQITSCKGISMQFWTMQKHFNSNMYLLAIRCISKLCTGNFIHVLFMITTSQIIGNQRVKVCHILLWWTKNCFSIFQYPTYCHRGATIFYFYFAFSKADSFLNPQGGWLVVDNGSKKLKCDFITGYQNGYKSCTPPSSRCLLWWLFPHLMRCNKLSF